MGREWATKKKKKEVVLLEVPRESQSSRIRERASASGEFDWPFQNSVHISLPCLQTEYKNILPFVTSQCTTWPVWILIHSVTFLDEELSSRAQTSRVWMFKKVCEVCEIVLSHTLSLFFVVLDICILCFGLALLSCNPKRTDSVPWPKAMNECKLLATTHPIKSG